MGPVERHAQLCDYTKMTIYILKDALKPIPLCGFTSELGWEQGNKRMFTASRIRRNQIKKLVRKFLIKPECVKAQPQRTRTQTSDETFNGFFHILQAVSNILIQSFEFPGAVYRFLVHTNNSKVSLQD